MLCVRVLVKVFFLPSCFRVSRHQVGCTELPWLPQGLALGREISKGVVVVPQGVFLAFVEGLYFKKA